MKEPPDKSRVVRLVKKSQSGPAIPQKEKEASSSAPPSRPLPHSPFRPERPGPPLEQPSWKKKPFRVEHSRRPARPARPRPPAPPPKPVPVVLTAEQKTLILDIYQGMVGKRERPEEGRRKKISHMLNIPYEKVAEVVRGFVTHERYRRTNFEIEKLYWRAIEGGQSNAQEISRQIAAELQLDEGRVWWWLEKLHEPRKSFNHDPNVEESAREKLISLYQEYLRTPDPPEKGLHLWLAEQVENLTPRQVHKVLWTHRMDAWGSLEGTERTFPPDPGASPVEDE